MITDQLNHISDTTKAFGDVPAAYAALVDLGTARHYSHIQFVNTTDQSVIVKFVNSAITAEYTVPAGTATSLDRFSHNGAIQYHYVGAVAPTIGYFKSTSWLGL